LERARWEAIRRSKTQIIGLFAALQREAEHGSTGEIAFGSSRAIQFKQIGKETNLLVAHYANGHDYLQPVPITASPNPSAGLP
jgi:hypothetical protein